MEKLKAISYKTLRPWVLASAALAGIFATLAAMHFLANSGRQSMALVLFAVVAVAMWIASREEGLVAARNFARNELDALRAEVSNALEGSGENYAWFKYVPYRPAFDTLVHNTREQVRSLELKAQEIERAMKVRRIWHSTKSICQDWQVVHFEAHRAVESITDHVWWSQAGEWTRLSYAMSKDDARGPALRPALRLVVNRK